MAAARGGLDPERGRVRVAAVTTAGEHVLPASLAAFLARHPGVDLRLEVGTSEHVWALLDAHEADLIIRPGARCPARTEAAGRRAVRMPASWSARPPGRMASTRPGPPG